MKEFIKEFKEFISRGNVMDMAVGIIIGGAFTNIVSSLVKDIINPILGLFGGMNFDQYHIRLLGQVTLNYGNFLTAVFNFLIMALVIFIIIKAMNTASEKLVKKEEAEEKAVVRAAVSQLKPREKTIIELRFGLRGGPELTQKEVADLLGISQSYISRLEKKIISHMKSEIAKYI